MDSIEVVVNGIRMLSSMDVQMMWGRDQWTMQPHPARLRPCWQAIWKRGSMNMWSWWNLSGRHWIYTLQIKRVELTCEVCVFVCSDILGLQDIQTDLATLIGEQADDVRLIGMPLLLYTEDSAYKTEAALLDMFSAKIIKGIFMYVLISSYRTECGKSWRQSGTWPLSDATGMSPCIPYITRRLHHSLFRYTNTGSVMWLLKTDHTQTVCDNWSMLDTLGTSLPGPRDWRGKEPCPPPPQPGDEPTLRLKAMSWGVLFQVVYSIFFECPHWE